MRLGASCTARRSVMCLPLYSPRSKSQAGPWGFILLLARSKNMAEKEYQRLTRARSRSAFGIVSTGRSSLWLGKDHLLSIESTGYTENYKRLYFRDIQGICIRKTELGKIWNLVFTVLGGLLGLLAI